MVEEHDETVAEDELDAMEPSPLAREHPRLYGVLLSINQRIDDTGSIAIWFFGLGGLGLCVAIHLRWLEPVLDVDLEGFRSWGVYSLIALATIFLGGSFIGWLEHRTYAAHRHEIERELRGTLLDRYTLIASIETDDSLEEIRALIKKDDSL